MKKLSLIVACLLLSNVSVRAIEGFDAGGSTAGVINRQNQNQLKELQIEKKYVDNLPTQSEVDKQAEQEKKDIIKGDLTYNPKFTLNKIIFKGNTVYSDKKLLELARDLLGQDVYLEDVMDLTVSISRYYQKHGFLTSYAYLEPQEIKDGIIVIDIKESRVAKKDAVGNKWEKDWYLENLALGGKGLNTGDVFNSKTLQGDMKNINKEAYLQGSAEITKDANEDTVIKLNVADRYPVSLDLAWDDYGRNYTGGQRFTSILGIDNLTGFGDRIYGGTILSSGANGALAGYQIPINKYGTKLSFDYSYSRVNLGGPYTPLNITGRATDYVLRLTHPLINTATKELNVSVAVDALNSTTESLALNQNIADYSLRVLRTGAYGMFDDKRGRTIGSLGVDLGTNALGASPNVENGPQSTFYKVIASIARIHRLPKDCLGIVRINGQYSPQSLYAMEQMFLGGAYSVRGYQPSELIGDYGVAGSFELRTPIPGLKQILPEKVKSWSNKAKLVFFYDWGYVKEHNDLYNYPNNFLQSVGVGSHIYLSDTMSLQIGIGIPVGPKYYNENSGRLYFSLNSEVDRIFMKPKERL